VVIDDNDEVNGTRQGKGLMPMRCVARLLTKRAYEKRTDVVQQEMSLAGLFKRIDLKDTHSLLSPLAEVVDRTILEASGSASLLAEA